VSQEVNAQVPAQFLAALDSLRNHRVRPEVHLTEVPAPARIAPFSVALSGELPAGPGGALDDHAELATGRFVALYDPAGQEAWDGTFRIVTLVRAHLDAELGNDPLLAEVAWTWLLDSLAAEGAPARALSGTVTRILSQSFGSLETHPDDVEVEIRASWSPPGSDLGPHIRAWGALLCASAGMPPLPEGVTSLGLRR
jgi:Protein of unknown function (DUF3000)